MKIEINDRQILHLLIAARSEYECLKYNCSKSHDKLQGMISAEGLRDTYNYILTQAHLEGELTFLDFLEN